MLVLPIFQGPASSWSYEGNVPRVARCWLCETSKYGQIAKVDHGGSNMGFNMYLYLDLPFVCKICAEIHPRSLPILAEILHVWKIQVYSTYMHTYVYYTAIRIYYMDPCGSTMDLRWIHTWIYVHPQIPPLLGLRCLVL